MSDEQPQIPPSEPVPPPATDAEQLPPELASARAVNLPDGPSVLSTLRRWELPTAIVLALALFLPNIWGYSLIDPWEGHYAEVGRRILEENDWVRIRWQNQIFRSKPILTFWLMAGSMKAHGIADDGGYSGEMAGSEVVIWAVRLPFALFAAFGLVMIWYMLRRLVSRRAAWIAFGVLGTTPFYFLVARQAITDMPMVATTMGALACFLLAVHDGDRPLRPLLGKLTAHHIFLLVVGLFLLVQLVNYGNYFLADPTLARGMAVKWPWLVTTIPFAVAFAALAVTTLFIWPARVSGDVYMFWAYTLVGVSVLAKGPPGAFLVAVTCALYVVVTGNWKFVARARLLEGVALIAIVAVPWHLAMALKDGRAFLNEYFGHHWFKRATVGVHGDTGTFRYFAQQVGIGMWPWIGLLPAALASALRFGKPTSTRDNVRLFATLWAVLGFAVFTWFETKFHHYILPIIPALTVLVALWVDDLISGRARRAGAAVAVAASIILLLMLDFAGEPKQLIELFIYRYDRAWPSTAPWNVDISAHFWVFGLLFAGTISLVAIARTRRYALAAFGVVAVVWAYWGMNFYMETAAPHWGQRALHVKYYNERQLYGVDIQYYGLWDVTHDWGNGGRTYPVHSVIPRTLEVGAPMTVKVEVVGDATYELAGSVSRIGDNTFWIDVPDAEVTKLSQLVERGRAHKRPRKRPWSHVNADRLIAWQLNWRGENFWQGGEIWGRTKETQTVYEHTDNKGFLEYLSPDERKGRTYFVITESQRANGLRGVLPTPTAKETVEVIDTSCNKFTLLRFTL